VSTERRALVAGAVGVWCLRLALSLSDPDLVHPVDPAELGHLAVLRTGWSDGLGGIARLLGAADNVHHGGFFWLALPVGLLRWLTGSDLLAVRGVAAGMAALGWAVWVELARRLGGARAALVAGLCLAVPVPWLAQWTATLWGSHSEAAVFTGLWALGLCAGWSPLRMGMLVGLGTAWDPLLWPTALLVLWHRRQPPALGGVALGWGLLRLPVLLAAPASIFAAPLTENPSHTPLSVVLGGGQLGGLGAALQAHLPLPFATPVDGLLTVAALLVTLFLIARRTRQDIDLVTILAVAPWVHLGVVVVLSPFGSLLAHRYLVAWWPAFLVAPWALVGRSRWLAAGPIVASLWALPLLVGVLGDLDPSLVHRYRSAEFQKLGLDRVPVDRVDGVVAFADAHPDSATPGFAAAFSSRWGYPVWGEDFPEQVRAAGLVDRWRTLSGDHDPTELARDFGWGLVVACHAEPGCVGRGVDQLVRAGAAPDALQEGISAAQRL